MVFIDCFKIIYIVCFVEGYYGGFFGWFNFIVWYIGGFMGMFGLDKFGEM